MPFLVLPLRSLISIALCVVGTTPIVSNAASDDGAPRAWAIQIDDDALALTEHDRDYTAGVYFTLVEHETLTRTLPLSRSLDWVNSLTGFNSRTADAANDTRALKFGLALFSPGDLEAEEALPEDRPYATLASVTSSRLTLDSSGRTAMQSSLTLGVLGLPIAGGLHRGLHQLISSPLPNGYSHQISDGAEPTFRYAVSRQRVLKDGLRGERPYSVRYGFSASIGYISELSAELAFRSGPLRTPWWSGFPTSADYAGQPEMAASRGPGASPGRGIIFEAGIEARLRLYNAFLQGQFRHSDVSFSSNELNHALLDGWVGVAFRFASGLELGYTIRSQSREIAHGTGARSFSWGSLWFVQRF